MIISERMDRLLKKLKNKEYRDAFAVESVNVGLPLQIKALREQNGWTQEDFEEKSGMKQSQISRYENINNSSFTLKTLNKIASLYDVCLIVRFAPISELVEWKRNLDSKVLEIPSYEEDPYFKNDQPCFKLEKEDKMLATSSNTVVSMSSSSTNKIVQINDARARKFTSFISSKKLNTCMATRKFANS